MRRDYFGLVPTKELGARVLSNYGPSNAVKCPGTSLSSQIGRLSISASLKSLTCQGQGWDASPGLFQLGVLDSLCSTFPDPLELGSPA